MTAPRVQNMRGEPPSWCGCCGRFIGQTTDIWCEDCLQHVGSPIKRLHERTYQAQTGRPCPFQVQPLP